MLPVIDLYKLHVNIHVNYQHKDLYKLHVNINYMLIVTSIDLYKLHVNMLPA